MITEEDWELIRGALADVAASDLGEDSIAAADLIIRIDKGEAQAPVKPDITAKPKGPSDRDVSDMLRTLAELVGRTNVNDTHQLMLRGSYHEYKSYSKCDSKCDPYLNDPYMYAPYMYQKMRDLIKPEPFDPKAFLKVTTS
jgi:hypothetical protein